MLIFLTFESFCGFRENVWACIASMSCQFFMRLVARGGGGLQEEKHEQRVSVEGSSEGLVLRATPIVMSFWKCAYTRVHGTCVSWYIHIRCCRSRMSWCPSKVKLQTRSVTQVLRSADNSSSTAARNTTACACVVRRKLSSRLQPFAITSRGERHYLA